MQRLRRRIYYKEYQESMRELILFFLNSCIPYFMGASNNSISSYKVYSANKEFSQDMTIYLNSRTKATAESIMIGDSVTRPLTNVPIQG